MPYRPRDIYRGRRKFRVPLTIFLFVIAIILVGGVSMFYFLQRYIVYDASGVTLQLPSRRSESVEETLQATPKPTFEPVTVEIVWEDPDFSEIDYGGWEELDTVQARFIPLDTVIVANSLATAMNAAQAEGYSGVVLEMKDASGRLAWTSSAAMAQAYGTAGAADVTEVITTLHEAGMTVAAQMSCFADGLMAERNWPVALQSVGSTYTDSDGVKWLDPYNRTIRTYLTDLAKELAAMGFDEIILADLYHPISEAGFTYSTTLQTEPDPVTAVCQAGRRIVEALEGAGVPVSARINVASLRNDQGSQTGQDMDIFWRMFARLYCPTSYDMAATDTELAEDAMNAGDIQIRFVPVSMYIPEGSQSYVVTS